MTRQFPSGTPTAVNRPTKQPNIAEIKFQVNDVVTHPKFGEGTVEEIVQLSNSVRLHIRFADDEVKKIDQKWLLRSGHK